MLKEKLEEKLENFLKNNKRKYYEDSVSYSGLREMKMIDTGDLKKLHLVNFMVSISD